mmetsp:Transcript_11656/g.33668  ORF Transcript_11656/g.33668 Transcript_11656/m.33668 type:complete len:201 (-) Transcript_11656:308-910(-)
MLEKHKARTAMVVGLDGAGKSSVLAAIGQVYQRAVTKAKRRGLTSVHLVPTSGMQMVEFCMPRPKVSRNVFRRKQVVDWLALDMSGQGGSRELWRYYASYVQALVFVVDISDTERVAAARAELHSLAMLPVLQSRRVPMLILAHKADLAVKEGVRIMTHEEVRTALACESIPLPWRLLSSRWDSEDEIREGFLWLTIQVA